MSKVRIEKFADGGREHSFAVPLFALRLFAWLLPDSALTGLAAKGLDLQAIVAANRDGISYCKTIDVHERGADKRVVVSLV